MAVSEQGGGKGRNSGEPAQHSSVNHRCAAHHKENPRCRFGRPKSAMELTASEPTGMRRARASPPPQYRDDPLLRFRDDRPVRGSRKHPQLQLHKSEPPDGSYDGSGGPAAKEGRDIENVFLDRIAHRRGAAVRIEALRSRMARMFRSPFGGAGRRAERWTL